MAVTDDGSIKSPLHRGAVAVSRGREVMDIVYPNGRSAHQQHPLADEEGYVGRSTRGDRFMTLARDSRAFPRNPLRPEKHPQ